MMGGQIIPIDTLLGALRNTIKATVREAFPEEEPDFVQERDKLCTGMMFYGKEGGYSFDLDPPVYLKAGTGYIVVRETQDEPVQAPGEGGAE